MKQCPNCNEWIGDNADVCFNCNYDFVSKKIISANVIKQREEQRMECIRKERERQIAVERKERERQIAFEKQKNEVYRSFQSARSADLTEKVKINDLYEYDVVTIRDNKVGSTDISSLRAELDKRGREGWRLVNTFTNELGVNSSSFAGYGTNATIDEVVLIFERCIKRASYYNNE